LYELSPPPTFTLFPYTTLFRSKIYPIRNDFFGEMITVSGLITGQDLIAQLKDQPLGETLLLPCNMLREGENVFLDDVTVEDVERDRKSTRLNSSHVSISYAVFC